LLGDAGKIVSTGRQRIAGVRDEPRRMTVTAILSPTESSITLHGYSATSPTINVDGGTLKSAVYQMTSGHFSFQIAPNSDAVAKKTDGDPVRLVKVVLQTR